MGIDPLPGARDLLGIFTPYFDHPRDRLVNFIAVEPIPVGESTRGYSELESGTLDPSKNCKKTSTIYGRSR